MRWRNEGEVVEAVADAARPITGDADDYDALLDFIGDAPFVLLGEASHGTHDFYRERARITQRLIAEKGFHAVAIEGDWPDAWRVHRWVRGSGADRDAAEALGGFKRFPTWMWRNTAVVDFVEWLRRWNDARTPDERAGFYGLDLYSMHTSIEAVLGYLDKVDPDAARRARQRYACFDHYGDDSQAYGLMTRVGAGRTCEGEVIAQLVEMQRSAAEAAQRDRSGSAEEAFHAEQNARLVKNAEAYYRSMYLSDVSSWNLRDRHMAETLEEVVEHLRARCASAKVVVWAHNSHLGDARATEMGDRRGELNVGQLMREAHGDDAVLIGFTTHTGTVTAASDWGAPAERKRVLPSRGDSHEGVLHAVGIDRYWLPLRGDGAAAEALRKPRLERAIGVIYRPESERHSHYFQARLADQFDALLHFDETRAVVPLERGAEWQDADAPETYPSGL